MLAACPFPANHGTPGSIREMAEAISREGHDVHIVTYHYGEPIPVHGPLVHRVPALTSESSVVVGPTVRRPIYDLQMVFTAKRIIDKYGVDIIHAHGYEAALVAGICRFVTRVPVIYSGHNTMSDELPSYDFIRPKCLASGVAKLLDAFVPRIADRCIPHSQNINGFFEKRGLHDRIEPIVNFGIDLEQIVPGGRAEIRSRYGLGGDPVVLYTGVMDRFQRLDLLLEAMAEVCRHEPTARLLLVVTIPNAKQLAVLREKAEELDILKRVVFTEPQPLDAVAGFLDACDIGVVSRPETPGLPIKLLNYMAAGKPTVMYASSASGLINRQHALLVSSDTSGALAAGILDLIRNPELRAHIGQQGQGYVRSNHDRRKIARQVIGSYFRTLHGCKAPANERLRVNARHKLLQQ
jgi:1,2-diacylglycerol 3-alpha-glucosyltransferase